MDTINRKISNDILVALKRGKSVLLLGARQTGKTTTVKQIEHDRYYYLNEPELRLRFEKQPELFRGEISFLRESIGRSPRVILDEVQKVPLLMDIVQNMIDNKEAQFILTGSSARKIDNLLPGRVVVLTMQPLSLLELNEMSLDLDDLLLFGSLPGVFVLDNADDKDVDLKSYVLTYLEEEIRREAVVRDLGYFARFLELSCSRSGEIMNLSKFSQSVGVAHTTISAYFAILEECRIATRVEPIMKSTHRRKLIKSPRFVIFDLGIRRVAANEGLRLPLETMGKLFEQWVGLELLRARHFGSVNFQVKFWKDPVGPEVDWVVVKDDEWIPIEVKWTSKPVKSDYKHLKTFINEYPQAKRGFVICQTPVAMKVEDNITVLPWRQVLSVL